MKKTERTIKRLSTPKKILVAILALLVFLIVGSGLFVLIKMYGMSIHATKTVAKPTVSPYDTPDPGLQDIDGDPDLSRDYDPDLDPSLIYNDPIYLQDAIDPDVVNILVLGTDTRGNGDVGRSDVMLIVSYNQRLNTVKAVSVLRDTWIYLPGRSLWNRVNTAYRFGGIGLAINTININFELDIQYYMLTDFENLVKIVDSVGGLDLQLSDAEVEYYSERSTTPLQLVEGTTNTYHMDGEQVLMHCRNRTIGNGDWSRTERQRDVMNAFLVRAKQESSVSSVASLVYRLMGYVETNLSPWQMMAIATNLVFGPGANGIVRATLPCPGSWSYAYESSMAVISIDIEMNKRWIHELFYGVYRDGN
ncbi:MAG: LCP family protein [Clostridia bacterium]|nr:LCP family protein [Clostridia bacterium]